MFFTKNTTVFMFQYNLWDLNIIGISGALFIKFEILNPQTKFKGGARDVNNIWVSEIIFMK